MKYSNGELEAVKRITQALNSSSPVDKLSDVFYDAREDEYGYDCDELAAVLIPIITANLVDCEECHGTGKSIKARK